MIILGVADPAKFAPGADPRTSDDRIRDRERATRIGQKARQEAIERIPEIADELRRRGLSVEVYPESVDARAADDVVIIVTASIDRDRPFAVMADRYHGEYETDRLIPRKGVSFDGLLQLVDVFLAGFRASR